VEVGVLLADPDDFAGMNEEYAVWFPADPPCRYAAKLGAVIPGVLVSIRMTAITGQNLSDGSGSSAANQEARR
jgi:2-iminobutanoate/2-iminopropanoate deaminase